ncbi:MAG: hypothetical protein HC915_18470 [Anaerolineae bacterium]|nr:hypothetical protein [Anaerolineae bacterium]
MLLLALGLVSGGIFWTLDNLGRIPAAYQDSWAVALVGFTLAWSFLALLNRHVTAFMAGTALIGVSLSLLLNVQAIAAWRETLVGLVLITIGLGIIARGLLLRQGGLAR